MHSHRVAFGPFVADLDSRSLVRDGEPVAIGGKAFLLLQAFLKAPGIALDKAALMDAAWPGTAVEESNLSVQIAALRRLLGPREDGGDWIATLPRNGYRFDGEVVGGNPSQNADDMPPTPSIAVLPFSFSGNGADGQYVADGIAEDLITALTRYRWFRVAARGASFAQALANLEHGGIAAELRVRYLVIGSVRSTGERWRVGARLIEAGNGNHLWADRYDLEFADVFAIQDRIAERIAAAIEPELLETEARRAVERTPASLTARDLVRRGMWHFHRVTKDDHPEARALFRRALAAEPALPEAHLWLARVSTGLCAYGWSEEPEREIAEGLDAGRQAVRLDPRNPYAHYALAIACNYADMPGEATLAANRARDLAPSFALGHLVFGMASLFAGAAAEATASLEHGLRLNPNDPQNFVWQHLLACAYLVSNRPREALAATLSAHGIRPDWRPGVELAACCHAALGESQLARQALSRAAELVPVEGDVLAPMRRLNPQWDERLRQLLKSEGEA